MASMHGDRLNRMLGPDPDAPRIDFQQRLNDAFSRGTRLPPDVGMGAGMGPHPGQFVEPQIVEGFGAIDMPNGGVGTIPRAPSASANINWGAMRAPTPQPSSSFPNLGARMANPSAFNTAAQAAPRAGGAMADLEEIGGSLGNALRSAGGYAGRVMSSPLVNNPVTRTAARAAGPVGAVMMAKGAWDEMADPTSRANQHNALYNQALNEGHYGDAAYEGAMSVANTVGAATGLRGLYDYLTTPGQQQAAGPQRVPAQRVAPDGALSVNYLDARPIGGAMTTDRFSGSATGPAQSVSSFAPVAQGGGRMSGMNQPMFYGDDPSLPLFARKQLLAMSPRPHYTTAADRATDAAMQQINAQFMSDWMAASGDPAKQRAAQAARSQGLIALSSSGRGYAPVYAMGLGQPSDE